MWLSRLGVHLTRNSRFTGTFLSRSLSSSLQSTNAGVSYSTQHTSKGGGPPQRWYALDPELEDLLVPRRLSITPLESWLTIRYSLPKVEVIDLHEKINYDPSVLNPSLDCPPAEPIAPLGEADGEARQDGIHCKNVLKIRRRKMNRHKYKKLQKRTKFLKRKIMDNRNKRKQLKFERDLKRIWRRAGLRKLPEGWQAPKIYTARRGGKE
ncbi:small ribosomal subunit protein mS38 [Ambystoma mexicanum]|uniref:small ribosomal subunit protein mS38 n=1 Tax=Ambystoma mexicanum TaxID=8296 RepID=UPI0037E899D4